MVSSKKRHHHIPRFYLQRFASLRDRDEISTYDQQSGEAWSSTVENTAVEKHLYSVRMPDGKRNTELEDLLAKIEGVAAPLLDKLLRDYQLDGEDRARFASFVAMMYVRTNAYRRGFAELQGQGLQSIMYANAAHERAFHSSVKRYEKDVRLLTEEEKCQLRDDMLDPSRFILSIPREATLLALGTHDQLVPVIHEMTWTLLDCPKNRSLITSDNPVVMWLPPQHHDPGRGAGFLHPKIEVTIPLSPNVCWFGHWRKPARNALQVSTEQTKELNRLRAIFAERYLYGSRFDEGIRRLAVKYRGMRQRVQVSGFGPKKRAKIQIHR